MHTLNLLDRACCPTRRINGSTFPAPDPAVIAQTPSPSDPDYATKIVQFVQEQAPNTFDGGRSTSARRSTRRSLPPTRQMRLRVLLPLFDLDIWGAPTSQPAADPNNNNFIYQRFQRGIMHYDKGCGCTQGLLLADYLKSVMTGQNLPPDLQRRRRRTTPEYYKQYAPGQPLSIARPARTARQRPDQRLRAAAAGRRRCCTSRPRQRLRAAGATASRSTCGTSARTPSS